MLVIAPLFKKGMLTFEVVLKDFHGFFENDQLFCALKKIN
jgi:hypothetical protein